MRPNLQTAFFTRPILQLIFLSVVSPAFAEETQTLTETSEPARTYLGIKPGSRDSAPGKEQIKSEGSTALVTWVGFQADQPGGRVFIQSSEPIHYHTVSSRPDQVVIEIEDAKLHSRNDARPIDTSAFGTAVTRIESKKKAHKTLQITITMRQAVPYEFRQEGNYLFVDFAPIKSSSNP